MTLRGRTPVFESLESRALLASLPVAPTFQSSAFPNPDDYLILYNPNTSGEPYTQQYRFQIGNSPYNPQETYQLTVSPPTAGKMNISTVSLAPGATTVVTFTPLAVSKKPYDVQLTLKAVGAGVVGQYKLTIASVTFGPKQGVVSTDVKNSDTPSGMPDRIPPRQTTPEYVNVTPDLSGSGQSVTLAVTGQSAKNGTVTINGSPKPITLTKSSTISLSSPDGKTQTAPGHAGNLVLSVLIDGVATLKSKGFSVSAIPIDFVQVMGKVVNDGGFVGFKSNVSWSSDSHVKGDLDQVLLMEQIGDSVATGVFKGLQMQTQTVPFSAAVDGGNDEHSIARDAVVSPGGTLVLTQVYTFTDKRTGSKYYASPNAGFLLTHTVFFDKQTHKWRITIAVKGVRVTANGFTDNAGAGDITKTF